MFSPVYNSAKIIKIHQDFPELWSQMFWHLFYGSQCIGFTSLCGVVIEQLNSGLSVCAEQKRMLYDFVHHFTTRTAQHNRLCLWVVRNNLLTNWRGRYAIYKLVLGMCVFVVIAKRFLSARPFSSTLYKMYQPSLTIADQNTNFASSVTCLHIQTTLTSNKLYEIRNFRSVNVHACGFWTAIVWSCFFSRPSKLHPSLWYNILITVSVGEILTKYRRSSVHWDPYRAATLIPTAEQRINRTLIDSSSVIICRRQ